MNMNFDLDVNLLHSNILMDLDFIISAQPDLHGI